MPEEDAARPGQLIEAEAVSWWSWRPGIRPGRAFVFGGLLSLLALFLLANGIALLLAGMLDSASNPLRVPGVATGQSTNLLGSPQLTLHLERAGFPPTIELVVTPAVATIPIGSMVIVDYAPHQRTPTALEYGGRSYALPGTGAASNLW